MRAPGWPDSSAGSAPPEKRRRRMTEQRAQRVRALFDQAVDLSGAAQKALLDACCADDPDLRARVEFLLACDARLRAAEAAPGWLDSPLVRTPRKATASADQPPSAQECAGPADDLTAGTRADALPG